MCKGHRKPFLPITSMYGFPRRLKNIIWSTRAANANKRRKMKNIRMLLGAQHQCVCWKKHPPTTPTSCWRFYQLNSRRYRKTAELPKKGRRKERQEENHQGGSGFHCKQKTGTLKPFTHRARNRKPTSPHSKLSDSCMRCIHVPTQMLVNDAKRR